MKEIFVSDNPANINAVLKSWLIWVFIALLPVVFDVIFRGGLIKSAYYYSVGAALITRLLMDMSIYRFYQVEVDVERKEFIFLGRTLLSRTRRLVLSFNEAGLEARKSNHRRSWLWEPVILYFLKGKMEIAEIKRSKDGFSVLTLQRILDTVRQIPLSVELL